MFFRPLKYLKPHRQTVWSYSAKMGHFHFCCEKDTFCGYKVKIISDASLLMPEYDLGAIVPFCSQLLNTIKPVLTGHSKRKPKFVFQILLSLNAGQKYSRMIQWKHSAILSNFIKFLLSFRSLFCQFLSGCFRHFTV